MDEQLMPERIKLAPNLEICRVLTGLWQVADIERNGEAIDPDAGADALQAYVDAGFDTFDMADHYGSAEIIAGRLISRNRDSADRPIALTKWCPKPGPMTPEIVRAGVQERLDRLCTDNVDLLQIHWWSYDHPAMLDALHELARLKSEGLIGAIGLTNFDAAHLHLALADGVPVSTNQVPFSLIDRRAAGPMAEICKNGDVHMLAYGTLCGGFLSERWLNKPEPTEITDWSKMKYKRFIDTAGGWQVFQEILSVCDVIARKHSVSIANVATRWVLEQPGVGGVIIGARLGESEHISDNTRLFSFALDDEDYELFAGPFSKTQPLPGDCGDEYRKPPFLTASGDLSHHIDEFPRIFDASAIPHRTGAARVTTGSEWEDIAGYCRAQRIEDRIVVSGTTATVGLNRVVAKGDAAAQTTFILDKIIAAITSLGGSVEDVVRTRIYLTDPDDAMSVSRAHGRIFDSIKPVNTLVVVATLIGDYKVEIEAEAIVRPQGPS